jgi:SAM-dependent methyltransferase/uncharacterized protein YbaR (Trm112 family)
MQYELLTLLKCPLTKTELRFKLISEFKKSYNGHEVNEVYEGIFFSETGFVFPIIKGIPRLLIESIYDYQDFLQKHLVDYDIIRKKLEENFPGLLHFCSKKNQKTKNSFELEWSFLNTKKDRLWHYELIELSNVFINEAGEPYSYFTDKRIIDVGSGHGLMTARIATFSKYAIGVELSRAVENAYLKNDNKQAWFIQGDLHFLPFAEYTFDVLYSSGVIHHTNNTELSLSLIESVLKENGKICLWLYHPRKSILHNFILGIRKVTSKLPLKLSFILLLVFVFPFTFLIKKIKNKNPPNYREEIIDLLDYFTPEFRFETSHDLAMIWLQRRKYHNIKITTSNLFGFSVSAEKDRLHI